MTTTTTTTTKSSTRDDDDGATTCNEKSGNEKDGTLRNIAARKVVRDIVDHYRQPLHLSSSFPDDDDDDEGAEAPVLFFDEEGIDGGGDDDDDGTAKAATKEEILSGLPPVVRHQLGVLLGGPPSRPRGGMEEEQLELAIVCAYSTEVRSALFASSSGPSPTTATMDPTGAVALLHYRLLLSRLLLLFLRKRRNLRESSDDDSNNDSSCKSGDLKTEPAELPGRESPSPDPEVAGARADTLLATLEAIASDVTRATCLPWSDGGGVGDDDDDEHQRRQQRLHRMRTRQLLPSLVWLLNDVLRFAASRRRRRRRRRTSAAEGGHRHHDEDADEAYDRVLTRCAVSMLAFNPPGGGLEKSAEATSPSRRQSSRGNGCGGYWGPVQLDGTVADRALRLSQYDCATALLPAGAVALPEAGDVVIDDDEEDGDRDASSEGGADVMDWKSLEWSAPSSWNDDPYSNFLARAVDTFWEIWKGLVTEREEEKELASSYSSQILIREVASAEAESCTDPARVEGSTNRLLQLPVSKSTADGMAAAVRAHFFGRDMQNEPALLVEKRYHLGFTVDYKRESDEKPYQAIPSRLAVFLHYCSLIERTTDRMLEELLPVCYELLTAPRDVINALGAAAVYRLLRCTRVPPPSHGCSNLWTGTRSENLYLMLEKLVKTCRHGPALALIGLALRHLLVTDCEDLKTQQRRRRTTLLWLTILHQNNHRTAEPGLMYGLLVGGIAPLLYDHATMYPHRADAMEAGRLGLSALLPLLKGGPGGVGADNGISELSISHAPQVRLAALIGMVNLMVAAYPIMPRHGGKILCHLLACTRIYTAQTRDDDADKNSKDCAEAHYGEELAKLAQRASVVALLLCGSRGQAVVERILSSASDEEKADCKQADKGDAADQGYFSYDETLLDITRRIQSAANSTLLASKAATHAARTLGN